MTNVARNSDRLVLNDILFDNSISNTFSYWLLVGQLINFSLRNETIISRNVRSYFGCSYTKLILDIRLLSGIEWKNISWFMSEFTYRLSHLGGIAASGRWVCLSVDWPSRSSWNDSCSACSCIRNIFVRWLPVIGWWNVRGNSSSCVWESWFIERTWFGSGWSVESCLSLCERSSQMSLVE